MDLNIFYEIGMIHKESPRFKRKLDAAINIASENLLKHNSPYVSVSGGKDSTVLLYIVAEASKRTKKPIRAWCHLSDASFPGTEDIIKEVCRRTETPLDIFRAPFSAFERISEKERQKFGKRGIFFDSIREYARSKDIAFVGVRAYESARRMKACKVHGQVFHSQSMGNVDVCYPIAWFDLKDIAAATLTFDIPMHPIYGMQMTEKDSRNKLNEQMFIRLGYITSKDLLNKGTALFIKVNYPDIFAKIEKAFPEIKSYI